MKRLKLYHLYRYVTLGILIVIIGTVFTIGLYTYRNISETITITARLIELRPEIAVTEQLDIATWTKIKEQVLRQTEARTLPKIKIVRDPFIP